MDVRCPQCQTLYELDERQTARGSVTLKCSRCQHVFRFEPGFEISQENQRRWMINSSRDGAILYLTDFTDLHRWIMEKKVKRDDTISRTGEKWVKLASIPEFAPIFIVVDSISDLTGSPEDSHIAMRVREASAERKAQVEENTAVETPAAKETNSRERVKTNVQFPNASNSRTSTKPTQAPDPAPPKPAPEPERRAKQPTPGELPPRPGGRPHFDTGERQVPRAPQQRARRDTSGTDPAWAISDDEPTRISDQYPAAPASRTSLPMILLFVVALVAGGAAVLYVTQPQLFEQLTGVVAVDDNDVVALGETTNEVATTSPEEAALDGPAVVSTAIDAAFAAKIEREGEIFDGILFATHRPIGEALDLASTRAAKAAEGGLVDEQLADARNALERGRVRKAKGLFEDVLDFDPRNPDAVAGLGFVYLEESKPGRAADQFKKAIDLGGGDGSAFIGLGTAERQRGDMQAAYEAYDLYLGRFPRGEKSSIARYQMEQLRKQLGM